MAIRVERNNEGNCINFHGSSNPTYWNSCLTAYVDSDFPDTINVVNDIITAQTGTTQYEFFRIPYTEFTAADNNAFASAQACADYITANANVIGLAPESPGTDLTGVTICFELDDTNTSIILDNGYSFGVNTIKAVASGGNISLKSISGDRTIFSELDHTNVCVNGIAVSGGLNDVINVLNELFIVGPFTSVVITDPYSTIVADVDGVDSGYTLVGSTAIDPVGGDIFTNSASGNYAGLKSTATINQAGEYFTFDIRGEGQIGFGLVHSQASYDNSYYSGNATYANPTTFAVSNSAHFGYQFSHWFHPTPNGSWTNYGANTSYSMRPGWSNFNGTDEQADWLAGNPIKVRVGIDNNGFISIETLRDGSEWVVHSRTSYPVLDGAEFHLGVKTANASGRVFTEPKVHLLEEEAPTLYYRYIESPDDNFEYPLFATAEEANYVDTQNGGSGTSHAHTYADDPTNTTWYMPDTGGEVAGTAAPTGQAYTEITSHTNADLTPAQFSSTDYTHQEGTAVNLQLYPAGATFTQSVSISPTGSGLAYNIHTGYLQGTLADVASDTIYTVTVTRANSYGSTVGTFEIQATNVAPAVAISGFTVISSSVPLIDSDTLDDGSAVTLDDNIEDGYRLKMSDAYVAANILPNIQNTDDKIFVGFAPDTTNGWGVITGGDFNCGFRFQYASANSITVTPVLGGSSGGTQRTHSYSTNLGYDFYLSNNGGVLEANYNVSSTDKTSEPTSEDGGSFTYTATQDTTVTGTKTIAIGVSGTTADISTSGLSEHQIPAPPVTHLTSWTKSLHFNGSNEHLSQTNTTMYSQPLQMNGLASTVGLGTRSQGETSDESLSRPWATAVVFKSDGYSGNQMIWNQGEGSSTNNDNIFLNVTATGNVHLGWGRAGVGYNQCRIATGISSSNWYGVYIAHSGERVSGNNASASNLADCFDIRIMSSADSFASLSSNLSVASNWTSTGIRMDRTVAGNFTIGGRGTGYSFRGKVASMVVTTLIGSGNYTQAQQPGGLMYNDAQIEKMIIDPVYWVNEYKVRQGLFNPSGPFRPPASRYALQPFLTGSSTTGYQATQVWLMGDGANDSYANGIRNFVHPDDQSRTKLQLNSMVSNDIETVNIPGLT